jgi:O-antigen/teichoic acid export membrane protein
MVNSAVHMVLFPEASRLVNKFGFDQINRVARLWEQLAVALVAVMIFAGSLGAPMLRLLSAPSFHGGTSYIPWLACSAFFYGLSQLGNLPFFIAGKMNKVAIFWSITAGLCLILNGLLIPRLGGLGAAVSQLLTYLVLSLFIITSGHSLMPMPIRWKSLLFILCLALAEIGFASVIVAPNPWIEMLLKFTAASMVSCYILHRIAPSILAQLANQCLSLVRP